MCCTHANVLTPRMCKVIRYMATSFHHVAPNDCGNVISISDHHQSCFVASPNITSPKHNAGQMIETWETLFGLAGLD